MCFNDFNSIIYLISNFIEDENGQVNEPGVDEDRNGQTNQRSGQVPPPAQGHPRQMGTNSIFITKRPEGAMRDVVNVECTKINGEDFKGTITYTEATVKMSQQKMGLQTDNLHSIKMYFNKCRMVSFKLKNQINIDEMAERECFTFDSS